MLPERFLERMEGQLGEEYPAFLQALGQEETRALRINSLKCTAEAVLGRLPFVVEPVPWCPEGFYYGAGDRPGLHPYHDAGAYYIQEPSAMAPTMCLGAVPGERVLDLCAAPGGKGTQIAAAMKGEGILVCNEVHPVRAKALSENIERMGITNAVVLNESPQRLSEVFAGYFDRILVDAPCSGEGMFRRREIAVEEWSEEDVRRCAARQDEILDCAARMLRPGGRLVYSTCTFSPEEDEGTVSRFLDAHPEFALCPILYMEGMEAGDSRAGSRQGQALRESRLEQDSASRMGLAGTVRMWPHKMRCEGHFFAVLEKQGSDCTQGEVAVNRPRNGQYKGQNKGQGKDKGQSKGQGKGRKPQAGLPAREYEAFTEFAQAYLRRDFVGRYLRFGEQLYLCPEQMISLEGLRALRPGLHLGTLRNGRFEPSHALALALRPWEASHVLDLPVEDERVRAYLQGGTFLAEGEKGWHLVAVDGLSLGWGKLSGGMMKNHYPKGLRRRVPWT